MLSLLLAFTRRLRQPTGLAVVVTPLALLVCCALAGQALGSVQQLAIQTQAIAQPSDYSDGTSSTDRLQVVNATGMAADQAACCVPKAVWPLGKSQLARRIAERWTPGPLVGIGAVSFGSPRVAGPTTPKVFDASSPEYLMLRQLRL
jgi:hypothetical protein